MAQSVSINGTVYDSVGVKYKGNSTYSSNQVKNPFHIELDTYKEQDYQGYKDIKLSNVKNDPSFVREVLSYKIGRQYMDASLSNYANVSVNGTLIGLYVNSESVSKSMQRLASGRQNIAPGDRSASVAIAYGMKAELASLKVGVQNATEALQALEMANNDLNQLNDMMVRLEELAALGTNGLNSTEDTAAIFVASIAVIMIHFVVTKSIF